MSNNFFRSFLVGNQSKLKLAAIVSSIGLTTTGFLWFQQQHHASSYSVHLKRYTASAEYPQLSKHSNLMAKVLTPQVRERESDCVELIFVRRCMQNYVIESRHQVIRSMMLFKSVLTIPVCQVDNILACRPAMKNRIK